MADPFPLAGFARIGLRIVSGIAYGRTEGGLILTGRKAAPYWAGPFTTDSLDPAVWSDLMGFLVDCVDRNLRVDFVHPRYLVPRSYTLTSWPLVTDPVLVSVTNPRTIVVSGLTVGMTLKRGDRLTLIQGELRCHRMIRADLVVASAISQSIALTPLLPTGVFAGGALVRFKNPPIRLAIVPGSFEAEEEYSQSPVTFEAEEALL